MNIFALHDDPVIAAQMMCDQHQHKMILESAQMMCTALHLRKIPIRAVGTRKMYLPSYQSHPCTQWVAHSIDNAAWLFEHVSGLREVRMNRGHLTEHDSFLVFCQAYDMYAEHCGTDGESSMHFPFALAMPQWIQERHHDKPIHAYRTWYAWKALMWRSTNREMTWSDPHPKPYWFDDTYASLGVQQK